MKRFSPNKLYKDPANGKIMGVCAGLADYTGIKANIIRVALVIGCMIGWFLPLVPIYFILGFVLDEKPKDLYENEEEETFWRTARNRPDVSAVDLKRRFRSIDRRIQSMESYMTSKRFKLDRDLRSLED
ncbi:phage shock protein C [Iodidimonas muriae]|nr:envelope stress response membrane protein PspC [Iodidimonas muriae]GGO10932.1 phage shock protein C [Iodidimonas muriae]